jgi:hypothetical protein
MLEKIRKTLFEVEAQLSFLKNEKLSNSENAIKSKEIYEHAVIHFLHFEKTVKFKNSSAEVEYFKEIKAKFLSYSFYFDKILEIEKQKIYSPENEEIFHREKKCIEYYNTSNLDFFNYHKKKETKSDSEFFNQANCSQHIFNAEINFLSTNKESVKYDILLAHFLANEMLENYLINELYLCKFNKIKDLGIRIKWTKHSSWLIELIYGLWFLNCINDGDITISELAQIFSIVFNVDLGDIYHAFSRFKFRKESYTIFCDFLKEAIIKKIEEDLLRFPSKSK